MALKDNAVLVAAQGFVFTADPGTAAPTPSELAAIDPETFGAEVQTLTVLGDGGTFTVSDGTDTSAALPYNATVSQVQSAVEGLGTIGAGNTKISGTDLATGLDIAFVGSLQGASLPELVVDDQNLTGTSAGGDVTEKTPSNGWLNIGHTSRNDMPEFGFDGGDTEIKGTWQKKRLREIATGDPVADYVTIHLEQWDKDSLELYYGEDAAGTPGVFGVNGEFVPLEKALLVIIVDGDVKLGFYAAKASIKREDAIDLPVDDFGSLPVKATFLNLGTHRLYDWINEELFA